MTLTDLIFFAGLAQLGVLTASAMVPWGLRWNTELAPLPRLHRQMHWVYGGYVGLAIVAFAALSIFNARELASGGALARGVCAYVAVFWGIRLSLQAVFDIKTYLTSPWMRAGYAGLGVAFASFTAIYAWAAVSAS
jgi:hypothetical protein